MRSRIFPVALCFYKAEPFLSDDSITENKGMNINNVSGSYVSNIRLQNTECNVNLFLN